MVYIYLAEGFEETEAVTILDILKRGGVDAKYVSISDDRNVKGAHGISVISDLVFSEADHEKCEMIILPGGGAGASNLCRHKGVNEQIKKFASNGKWVAAICAAPMVLAGAGILSGRAATIYPGMEKELKDAKVTDSPVVRDGNIITSQAPGTAMTFALYLLVILKDEETSGNVEEGLCLV